MVQILVENNNSTYSTYHSDEIHYDWLLQYCCIPPGQYNPVITNDSTRQAMDQSSIEQSSPAHVQSKKNFNWNGTDPVCWHTRLDSVRSDPSQCPWLGYTLLIISILISKIYINGVEYSDRCGRISITLGIWGWVGIQSDDESCFQKYLAWKQCKHYKRKWIGPDQELPV